MNLKTCTACVLMCLPGLSAWAAEEDVIVIEMDGSDFASSSAGPTVSVWQNSAAQLEKQFKNKTLSQVLTMASSVPSIQKTLTAANGKKYGTGSNLVTQTRSSDSIQRVKRPQWRSQVHDRGNKPDAHQQPEEKHATDNTLTVCVIFGGEPANSANNQRAYYALTQYGKDNQWPLMPSISHFTLPPD